MIKRLSQCVRDYKTPSLLTLLFINIEPREPDERAEKIKRGNDLSELSAAAACVNDHSGERSEADKIAKGIDLYAEKLFAPAPIHS